MGCGSSTLIKENDIIPMNTPRGPSPDNLFLMAAKKNNIAECLRLWDNETINLSQTDSLGNNAFHYLATSRETNADNPWFKSKNHPKGNETNFQGLTPFFMALLVGNYSIARTLWDNVVTNNETIVPAALNTNNPRLILLLLKFHEFHEIELPNEQEILTKLPNSDDNTIGSLNKKKQIKETIQNFFREKKPPPTLQPTEIKMAGIRP